LNKTVKRLGYSIEDKFNDIKDKFDEWCFRECVWCSLFYPVTKTKNYKEWIKCLIKFLILLRKLVN
jgi:hypothetical protein